MKVAIAFWGLTRSLKYTLASIIKNIFNPLNENYIKYTIFMHTYSLSKPYTNKWGNEYNIMLNNEEYKLLKPDHVIVDDQEKIKHQLQLHLYRSKPDPWNTNYETVDNFILAMYSKSKVTDMIDSSYDIIIYLRPDMEYNTPLNIKYFPYYNNICISNINLVSNFNDQFCICNKYTYKQYGHIFNMLLFYSKKAQLHSETVYYNYIKTMPINIIYIPFIFNKIRANGLKVTNFSVPNLIKNFSVPIPKVKKIQMKM